MSVSGIAAIHHCNEDPLFGGASTGDDPCSNVHAALAENAIFAIAVIHQRVADRPFVGVSAGNEPRSAMCMPHLLRMSVSAIAVIHRRVADRPFGGTSVEYKPCSDVHAALAENVGFCHSSRLPTHARSPFGLEALRCQSGC